MQLIWRLEGKENKVYNFKIKQNKIALETIKQAYQSNEVKGLTYQIDGEVYFVEIINYVFHLDDEISICNVEYKSKGKCIHIYCTFSICYYNTVYYMHVLFQ